MTSIRPRPATITDIAKRAGVSTATVSYVLNDAPGSRIPENTRTRVRAIADELGYVPHASARSLRKGTSDLVLYVQMDVVHGPLAAEFHHQLTLKLRDMGYTLLQYGGERHRGVKAARTWAAMRPSAVIVEHERLTPAGIELLHKSDIQVVATGVAAEAVKGEGVSTLNMDDVGVGARAGEHLVGRGYRDLAAVVPRGNVLRRIGTLRLQGFQEAATRAGATVRALDMDWSPESAAEVVRTWLDEGLPEAVFGYNDEFSGLLLGALQDAKVRVPDQTALVGADDVMLCRMLRPRLTSVRLEPQSIEATAGEIIRAVTGRTEVHLSPWTPTLVQRET